MTDTDDERLEAWRKAAREHIEQCPGPRDQCWACRFGDELLQDPPGPIATVAMTMVEELTFS
jgi:hypothetical protein